MRSAYHVRELDAYRLAQVHPGLLPDPEGKLEQLLLTRFLLSGGFNAPQGRKDLLFRSYKLTGINQHHAVCPAVNAAPNRIPTAVDVFMQLKRHVDIGLSHDWPRGIARHGDLNGLLRAKSFLRNEASSPAASLLMIISCCWYGQLSMLSTSTSPWSDTAMRPVRRSATTVSAARQRRCCCTSCAQTTGSRRTCMSSLQRGSITRPAAAAAAAMAAGSRHGSWRWTSACRGAASCR
jgi:hypothetical protein